MHVPLLFNCSLVKGHLSGLQLVAVMNKAAKHFWVQALLVNTSVHFSGINVQE